jgi:hypothetical protein
MKNSKRGFLLIEIVVATIIIAILLSVVISFAFFVTNWLQEDYRYTAVNLAREVLEFGETTEYTFTRTYLTCWYERPACGSRKRPWATPCGTCCCAKECVIAQSYQLVYHYYPDLDKYKFDVTKDFKWLENLGATECGGYTPTPYTIAQVRQPGFGGDEDTLQEVIESQNLDYDPFLPIGDIKAKSMAPDPNITSVVITYTVTSQNPDPETNLPTVFNGQFRKHTVEVKWINDRGKEKKVTLSNVPLKRVNDTYKLKIAEFGWGK